MIVKKQYARRSLEGFKSSWADPFEYRPITSMSEPEAIDALRASSAETRSSDIDPDPAREFRELVAAAGSAYDPERWFVAYLEGERVGVVFPQRYWDKMEEGSIFLIGVEPRFRNRGFGKILHAHGLEVLAEIGCTGYVGSTDVANAPMIHVFLANGCGLTAVRTIDMSGHSDQAILDPGDCLWVIPLQ